jgi:hypothetical protein
MAGEGEFDWAGYGFVAVGHHDGRFIHAPGVFGFVRRCGAERVLLYAGEAEDLSAAAGPAHPAWAEALRLGMSEVHLFTRPRDRLERLLVLDRVVRRCLPILNVVEEGAPEAMQALAVGWAPH